jgi:phospholipase/carboxylesterase
MPDTPIEFESGPSPSASLIVLHGLGADGNDFVPVCEALQLAAIGAVRFVLPHAPVRPVTINGGYAMRAWYDILGTEGAGRGEDEMGLRASINIVQGLIDRERARGVAAERIVLMGFSQGCAMTLCAGLRYPERLGGLVGLSGYLPLAAKTAAERAATNASVPIFMAHGQQDEMIPIVRATASRDALHALGHAVEWHSYPMGHSVCIEEIGDINRWLLKVWGATGAAR